MGRLLRVLHDLDLAEVDSVGRLLFRMLERPADLAASPSFAALLAIAEERRSWLTRVDRPGGLTADPSSPAA